MNSYSVNATCANKQKYKYVEAMRTKSHLTGPSGRVLKASLSFRGWGFTLLPSNSCCLRSITSSSSSSYFSPGCQISKDRRTSCKKSANGCVSVFGSLRPPFFRCFGICLCVMSLHVMEKSLCTIPPYHTVQSKLSKHRSQTPQPCCDKPKPKTSLREKGYVLLHGNAESRY